MKLRALLLSGVLLIVLLAQPMQFSSAANNNPAGDLVFDFVANAANAYWRSGAGLLPYPGTSGDFRGFAQQVDAPILEDGSTSNAPGLLTVPQNKYDGYIQGVYPEYTVQKNDHFQAIVGCEYGAASCYVTFRLDYLTPGGATKIVWKWKEKYEGRYYAADIDLSALAGQKVRFMLTMLATGFSNGDRAIWAAPRIVRPGNGLTPLPTLTPTSTPFSTPPPVTPSNCNKAAFVTDITVRDGTSFTPGAAFTKGWRLLNAGSCTWSKGYSLVFFSGEQLGAPTSVNLPWEVVPGKTVDIAINAIAPSTPGPHRGNWILRNTSGAYFGIGPNGTDPIWIQIHVTGSPPDASNGFDFVANACAAQWRSGAGNLPCPGTDGDARGFMLNLAAPRLEDGTISGSPGLLTMPQSKYDGYLQGVYPTFTVQPGDRFRAQIGCEYGASCYVTFRLDYLTPGGATKIVWQWKEKNEDRYYNADIDLTPLAGQSVRFMLTTLATGFASGDRALWVAPRIVRAGLATPTPTPLPANWLTYSNPKNGFRFKYPAGQLVQSQESYAYINLPFTSGANLVSKYVEVTASNELSLCALSGAQTTVINNLVFLKQVSRDQAMGNIYDAHTYATVKGNTCVKLMFVLHSGVPGNYVPTAIPFDLAAEAAVFEQILATYAWVGTPTPVIMCTPPSCSSPNVLACGNPNGCPGGCGTICTASSPTPIPPDDTWSVYTNATYGLQFKYPPNSQVTDTAGHYVRIALPIAPNTNLISKSVEAVAWDDLGLCPAAPGPTVILDGVPFAQYTQVNQAIGQTWEATTYTAILRNLCYRLIFELHSNNLDNSTPAVTPFDKAAETAVYGQILSTFKWLTPQPTATPLPTETPTPTLPPTPVFSGPYAVLSIPWVSALTAYAAPGTDNPVAATFPLDTKDLSRAPNLVTVGGERWAEIRHATLNSGWVLDTHLTEYVTPEFFVADSRPINLIASLKQAMNNSDGNLFAALISPRHGLRITYHGNGGPAVLYTPDTAQGAFTDPTVIAWGAEGASGSVVSGTFTDVVRPKLLDTLNANYELHANDPQNSRMYPSPWPVALQNLNFFSVFKPASEPALFNWREWLVGFEYVNGQPYIVAMLQFIWEP